MPARGAGLVGRADRADAALGEVLRLGAPLSSALGPASPEDLLRQLGEQVPEGMHWNLRTRSVATLTADVIEVLVAATPLPDRGRWSA